MLPHSLVFVLEASPLNLAETPTPILQVLISLANVRHLFLEDALNIILLNVISTSGN